MPRSAARVEEVGPFTLFVGTGAWPYYARPRLGLEHEFTAADVEAVRARQRELGVPEAFEWVHETTPSLLRRDARTLEVLEAPLMVLDRAAWRPPETTARLRAGSDPTTTSRPCRAVQDVAFTHGGTAPGPEGIAERDARRARRHVLPARADARAAERDGRRRARGYARSPPGCTSRSATVTEIVGVATLPAVRRQGLGGAVTGALVEDALDGGVETVFLSAGSEDDRPRLRAARLPPDRHGVHRGLSAIDAFLDAGPRAMAETEEIGPFTLFVSQGPWPYYARPRLGVEHAFTAGDVDAVRARQRELLLPETFQWVHETAPSLRAAMTPAGDLRAAADPRGAADGARRVACACSTPTTRRCRSRWRSSRSASTRRAPRSAPRASGA